MLQYLFQNYVGNDSFLLTLIVLGSLHFLGFIWGALMARMFHPAFLGSNDEPRKIDPNLFIVTVSIPVAFLSGVMSLGALIGFYVFNPAYRSVSKKEPVSGTADA